MLAHCSAGANVGVIKSPVPSGSLADNLALAEGLDEVRGGGLDFKNCVSVLEIQSAAPNLIEAFRQWQVIGEGTRGDKTLYHAYISPAEQYANIMTPEQWLRAADVLAKELGLENSPRHRPP